MPDSGTAVTLLTSLRIAKQWTDVMSLVCVVFNTKALNEIAAKAP